MAVVVPSPATSSVFVATSLRSCARISNGYQTMRAMVTPSLVMVGAPFSVGDIAARDRASR
jgi:hypothetical protein